MATLLLSALFLLFAPPLRAAENSAPLPFSWPSIAADFSLKLPDGAFPFQGRLQVRPLSPPGEDALVLELKASKIVLDLPWLKGVFALEAQVKRTNAGIHIPHFLLRGTAEIVEYGDSRIENLPVEISGALSPLGDGEQWRAHDLDIRCPDFFAASGEALLNPHASGQPPLVKMHGEVTDLGAFLKRFRGVLPDAMSGADGVGRAVFALDISDSAQTPGASDISFILTPQKARVALAPFSEGASSMNDIHGDLRILARHSPQGLVSWSAVSDLRMVAQGSKKGAASYPVTLALNILGDQRSISFKDSELYLAAPVNTTLELRGALDIAPNGDIASRDVTLRSNDFGALNLDLALTPPAADEEGKKQQDAVITGAVEASGLDMGRLGVLASALGALPLEGWNYSGALDVDLALSGDSASPTVELELGVRGLAFSSPDGMTMGDKLSPRFRAKGRLGAKGALKGDFTLAQGESLLGAVYLNHNQAPLTVDFTARADKQGDFTAFDINTRLKGYAALALRGSAKPTRKTFRYRGTGELRDANVSALFNTFLRDPLAAASPGMSEYSASGAAKSTFAFAGSGSDSFMKGFFNLNGAHISDGQEQGLRIKGLDLDLPFAYGFGKGQDTHVPSLKRVSQGWGRLTVDHISLPLSTMKGLDLGIKLSPGKLSVNAPVTAPVLGGLARLSSIKVLNPLSKDFEAQCSFRLSDINLAELPAGGFPLKGFLDGNFSKVRLNANELALTGGLAGEFFGGRLAIENMGVLTPFSDARRMLADITLHGMDLEQVSSALGIGRVTGVMDVDIQGFQLAYGQPVALSMTAQSVPTRGVDQEVSLKAVNAISVMGTGSGLSGMGVSMFASFFKNFSYESIGFACELQNDVFRVRGLITEGGVEYLIKKPPLFGINVINGNPENNISFSDMLERVQRVVSPGDANSIEIN